MKLYVRGFAAVHVQVVMFCFVWKLHFSWGYEVWKTW